MQILKSDRTFETRSANPYLPWGSTAPPLPGTGGLTAAGTNVTQESALQLAAVWGSSDLISSAIGTLPIRQWKMSPSGEPKAMDSSPVIEQPWPEITQRDFIVQGTVSNLIRGNIFGRITARDERLYPAQIQLQSPNHVSVKRDRDGHLEWRYGNVVVPSDDVTRAMGMSLPGSVVGMNPIEYMRNVMGVARAQDLWQGAYYANSAEPRGVIQVEGDLDPNETLALAKAWNAAHQGIGNSHLPAVLTGGATFEPISMSFADAQYLELMQFSAQTISGFIYRVPPHMLGMVDRNTSWGTGIEQMETGFVRNTLLIWLARWEDLMTSWLPPRQFVTFDLSERLKGDTLQRWQSHQIARVIGAMNSAEIRRIEKLPTITDPEQAAILDSFEQPLNSSPVKQLQGDGGDHSAKPKEKD